MGKIGRRGPHRERKKRIADERERGRIRSMAREEFRRQAKEERLKLLTAAQKDRLREYNKCALAAGLSLAAAALSHRG